MSPFTAGPGRHPQKVVFLRGARFANSIGDTDWRVGLAMPQFGFETWILGQGRTAPPVPPGVHLVPVVAPRGPVVRTLALSFLYARLALRPGPDAIVCNPGVAPAGLLVKRLRPRTKLVLDIRSPPVEAHGLVGSLRQGFFALLLRWDGYDGVTVISAGLLQALQDAYRLGERFPVAVWGSGYDPQLFHPLPDGGSVRERLKLGDRPVILYHGTLSPGRGLDGVIRCLPALNARRRDRVAAVLVGAGEETPRLRRLAQHLDVTRDVRFVGLVPHAEIPGYLAAADLGMVPLPDHPWWRHQSPIKVFECLAMGVPVIATDLPGHRDISAAVLRVSPADPPALAGAVESYLALPPGERRRLAEIAIADAAHHTWEAKARILADFLHGVLGG